MRVPRHVGIIPDGNRRWAVDQGLGKKEGYTHGLNPGLEVLKAAKEYAVEEITYYGFTVDNCKRPMEQVRSFQQACVEAVNIIRDYGNVSLLVVGNEKSKFFPAELLPYRNRTLFGKEEIRVNFLVNYGWDWDLQKLRENDQKKQMNVQLHSGDISRIDMIIRWGGMRRLSGFLPVQSVYADFFVVQDLWPDYQKEHFDQAINWYQMQDVTLGG